MNLTQEEPMSTLTLHLDEALLKRLQQHAAANRETTESFTLKALYDALNMWDDFYELDDKLEQDMEEERPTSTFFIQA